MAKGSRSRGRESSSFANRSKVAPRIQSIDLPLTNHIQYLDRLLKIQHNAIPRVVYPTRKINLQEIEDRRRFAPFKSHIVRDTAGRQSHVIIDRGMLHRRIHVVRHSDPRAKLREGRGSLKSVLQQGLGFGDPENVMICVRRKRRREVIFALRKGGAGGSFKRKVRRNNWSEIYC